MDTLQKVIENAQKQREITPKEKKWADLRLAGGSKREATIQAYNIGSKGGKNDLATIDQIGKETSKKPTVLAYINKRAMAAARVTNKLLKDKSSRVRLMAAKDILDRAGFAPVKRVEEKQAVARFSFSDLRRKMEENHFDILGDRNSDQSGATDRQSPKVIDSPVVRKDLQNSNSLENWDPSTMSKEDAALLKKQLYGVSASQVQVQKKVEIISSRYAIDVYNEIESGGDIFGEWKPKIPPSTYNDLSSM